MPQLTEEQKYIEQSNDQLIVKACAGSGKTSSFVAKAKHLQSTSDDKILYLCFNKSIQTEAQKKFPKNTTCKSFHGLAYQFVGRKYKIALYGLSLYDIKNILNIPDGEDYWGHKITYIIKTLFNAYCASDHDTINEVAVSNCFDNADTIDLCEKNLEKIYAGASTLWHLMDSGKLNVTHDFYVKKYSFLEKDLGYDWVMVDEAQDISPCFIKIINSQRKAKKVVCGDFSQAIYGWRFGVGDFAQYFPELNTSLLSHSFRFKSDIADLCNYIIELKKSYFGYEDDITVHGKGNNNELKTKAVIGRTNLALLSKILEYTAFIDNVYVEGGFKSMLVADGFSLYDILSLYFGKKDRIKNEFIASFNSYDDLCLYAETVSANDLKMLTKVINYYGGTKLITILNDIKSKEVFSKAEAELIFTTVHKSKGLEYDVVELANDFITELDLVDHKNNLDLAESKISKIMEEINLLYVASSRVKNKLIYDNNSFLNFNGLDISNSESMRKHLNLAIF